MEFLTVAEAATRLSLTTQGTMDCLRRGELVRVDADGPTLLASASVTALQQQRSAWASAHVAGGVNAFATYVRDRLRPQQPDRRSEDGTLWTTGGSAALRGLEPEAAQIFGRSVLEAAAFANTHNVCRWCVALSTARVNGSLPPRDDAPTRILLGSRPCAKERAYWSAQRDAESRRVRADLAAMTAGVRQRAEEKVARTTRAARDAMTAAARVGSPLASIRASAAPPVPRTSADAAWGPSSAPRRVPTQTDELQMAIKRANRARLMWKADR